MRKKAFVRLNVHVLAFIVCLTLLSITAYAGETAQVSQADIANEFRAEVIRLVNIERVSNDIAELSELDSLTEIADIRAQEAAASFSHTRPDGKRCFTVFSEYSLKYKAAGENLAYGFKTPEELVQAWMDSETHRANILDPDFTYIGIGYHINENGRGYYSQLFFTPIENE